MVRKKINPYLLIIIASLTYLYWPEPSPPSPVSQKLSDVALVELAKSYQAPVFQKEYSALSLLGEQLFFDGRFSASGGISCGSCHQPDLDFTDGLELAKGLEPLTRNTPTLINAVLLDWFFWDGRAPSLELQAMGPIQAHKEHRSNRGQVAYVLFQYYRDSYEEHFGPFPSSLTGLFTEGPRSLAAAFPNLPPLSIKVASYILGTVSDFQTQTSLIQEAANKKQAPNKYLAEQLTLQETKPSSWTEGFKNLSSQQQTDLNQVFLNFAKALATYQRQIIALDSPFDAFVARLAESEVPENSFQEKFGQDEWLGFRVFAESGCINCHNGPNFTDQQFHNIGLPFHRQLDIGRARGIIEAKESPITCRDLGHSQRESCRELEYVQTDSLSNVGAFKTPTLRNLGKTAPYMHDGRFSTLSQVLDHYEDSEIEAGLGHRSESLQKLSWTAQERRLLEDFLKSLQSDITFLHRKY